MAGLLAGSSEQSQKLTEKHVPMTVKNAFEKRYQGIKATWSIEDENYKANFRQHGRSMSTVIDRNGIIVETEIDIAVTDQPGSVLDFMQKNCGGVKIEESARIVQANGDINYETEVHHKDTSFDAEGKFINKMKD
jgi:hypothetical protein